LALPRKAVIWDEEFSATTAVSLEKPEPPPPSSAPAFICMPLKRPPGHPGKGKTRQSKAKIRRSAILPLKKAAMSCLFNENILLPGFLYKSKNPSGFCESMI
jgi:hypothetical protein